MTRTLEHDVADYLWDEADRVVVYDTLADIEDGITFVSVAQSSQPRSSARLLLMAAAVVAVVMGLLATLDARPQTGSVAVQSDTTVQPTVALESTPSSTTPLPKPELARVTLPAGGVVQGVVPSCTTLDGVEYDCTIVAYPDLVLIDLTGFTTPIVDDTSHVSGGCRSTTPDALSWTCFIGQAAVDQGVIGADYLGDPALREYVAG